VLLELGTDLREFLQNPFVETNRAGNRQDLLAQIDSGGLRLVASLLPFVIDDFFDQGWIAISAESDVMLSIGVPIRTAFFANEIRSVLRVGMVEALQGLRRFPSAVRRGRLSEVR
jgi:hypothetical protein